MTRVALLSSNWYPQAGGGVVHVDELATRLVLDHDCDVDIITKWTAPSDEQWVPDGATLTQVPGTDTSFRLLNDTRYVRGAVKIINNKKFDIVHAHTNIATFPLQILNLLEEAKTVVTVHGASLDLSVTFTGSVLDHVFTVVRRMILQSFHYDAVIAVSSELADVLAPHHNTVRFIANGVDVDTFPEPDGYGCRELLFVGRLRPKKNPTDAVRAMQYVVEEYPAATLHIVGEGPLRDDVTEAVERLQLGENVTVHGFIDDSMLKRLYKRCSLLILPSDWEGHPLVLLEAWASGDLVIGTDVEGIREFLADGYGELVPVNDPEALGRAVITYFSKTETIKMIGTEAQSFVRSEYSWDSTVAQTYRVYEELLNKRNPK